MSSIFATPSASTSTPAVPEASLRVQTSIEGAARAIVWGQTRLAGNLIWYGDFYAVAVNTGGNSGGGKGGMFSQPASQGTNSFDYYTSVEIGLCEGAISSMGRIWADKALTNFGTVGLIVLAGANNQVPWAYLSTYHPGQALGYRYSAMVAGNVSLGSNSSLPNWTFEVTGAICNGAPGLPDAEFTAFLSDFLTNPSYGVPGWSGALNADWTQARQYTLSAGLLISYALTSQTSGQSLLSEIIKSVNVMPVWSDAQLKLVPRGDALIAGNGAAYIPPASPIYDLADSDFLPNQSGFGTSTADPVSGKRTPPRQQNNVIKVTYLDRDNDYNPASLSATDDGAIISHGQRGSSGVNDWKWFQTSSAAQMAASLALGRERIANTYAFTLRPRYILLDPGDIVTITDPALGLLRQWVRITDIQENSDRSLNVLSEEYLTGTANAPLYGREANQGSAPNYNVDPGATNAPFIIEPTDQLGGGLALWIGTSGVNPATYGGCDVHVSYDGASYTRVSGGRAFGIARTGVLAQALPAVTVNNTGPTIDITNTLSVDLTQSHGTLLSGSQSDALALNTICYVDGEIIAYETATLNAANKYWLNYLVRNAYGTEAQNVTHAAGSKFMRLDNAVVKVPFDKTRIGATVYLKFVPFNVWGAGGKTLADVPAYSYKIAGSALASPLPVVQNAHTVFEGGFQKIWWDDIGDFRSGIRYVIKKGTTFAGAQTLGDVAHPPFVAFGDGTYWIQAYCQPVASLLVYSETPTSITIAGAMLTKNIISTINFQSGGWAGTFSQVSKEGTDPTALLRLTGASNILTDPNVLADTDVLNAGATFLSGTWTSSAIIDAGYVADCSVNASWLSAGQPIGTDVLSMADFLNAPDVLASASSAYVNVWVEIRWATAGTFASPTWGAWQKYVPGIYRAEFIQFRVQFVTVDTNIIAYCTAFSTQISIPARIDHYIGNNVTTAGLTITFEPDDAAVAKPFNGGSLVGGAGNHPLPSVSMDWQGSPTANFVITALSLSSMTFHFVDGTGATVAVNGVDVYVEGY